MFRHVALLAASAAAFFAGGASRAAEPVIVGNLDGIELCTQEICGEAVFVGRFLGAVDGRFAFGYWVATANYGEDPPVVLGPLPEEEGASTNMAGQWRLDTYVLRGFRFRRESFGGELAGTLTNRGDNDRPVDNFDLQALLANDFSDAVFAVSGILRHDRFPPAVSLDIGPPE